MGKRIIEVVQEIQVATCEFCDLPLTDNKGYPNDHLQVSCHQYSQNSGMHFHNVGQTVLEFCDYPCLAAWAANRKMR